MEHFHMAKPFVSSGKPPHSNLNHLDLSAHISGYSGGCHRVSNIANEGENPRDLGMKNIEKLYKWKC